MRLIRLIGQWDRLATAARWVWGSAIGLLGIVFMSLAALTIDSLWNVRTSEVALLLPVLIASLFGLGPGLITTIVAAVVVYVFFLEPPGAWPPATIDDLLVLVSFTGLAIMVSTLVAALTRARWRYQSLVDAAPTPIVRSDARGRVEAANPAAVSLFDMAPQDLIGQSFEALLGVDGAIEGRPWRWLRGPEKDIALQEVRAPLPGGQGEVCILQDVTAQVSMLEMKEGFLLRVAHELRTPVTAQSALLELLANAESLAEGDRRLAVSALAASQRLGALVESVLDLRSIRAGTFLVERAPLPIQQVVAEAVATVEPLLHTRGQAASLNLPRGSLLVEADRRRLVQVVVNLLTNASRYGPDGQVIETAVVRLDDTVRVEVRNRRAEESGPEEGSAWGSPSLSRSWRRMAGGWSWS